MIGLVLLLLAMGYNWRAFHNLNSQEAMDTAQLARNLAEGKGYTTLFIRPFSLHLVKKRSEAKLGPQPSNSHADYTQIKGMHPDLANPPVYPCLLAGLMKVLPFNLHDRPAESVLEQRRPVCALRAGFYHQPVQSTFALCGGLG